MPLCTIYANCQADGLAHFMKKTERGAKFDYAIHHNWQIIMGEEDPKGVMENAAKSDVFITMPTPSLKYGQLSSEEMIKTVPAHCKVLRFSYQFNYGFFPIIVWPGGYETAEALKARARVGDTSLLDDFDAGKLHFDCAIRMLQCLAEQERRERTCDIKTTGFILSNFQKVKLFLDQHHPASAMYAELAKQVDWHLDPDRCEHIWEHPLTILWEGDNEAKMNGAIPLSPFTIRELNMTMNPDPDQRGQYREVLGLMIQDKGVK